MNEKPNRWTSRKFWISAATLVIGTLVLLGVLTGEQQDSGVRAVEVIVGGVMDLLAALGYVISEAAVDAKAS